MKFLSDENFNGDVNDFAEFDKDNLKDLILSLAKFYWLKQ